MTKDDIIRMAREVWGVSEWTNAQAGRLERFAALVAAAEREACAKVAAWILKMEENDVSSAIRAKGQ